MPSISMITPVKPDTLPFPHPCQRRTTAPLGEMRAGLLSPIRLHSQPTKAGITLVSVLFSVLPPQKKNLGGNVLLTTLVDRTPPLAVLEAFQPLFVAKSPHH